MRSALFAVLTLGATSCATLPSSSSVPSDANAGIVVPKATPLQRAPYDQPYLLVRAGELFTNTTDAEDSPTASEAIRLRESLDIPFAAVGWYATTRERARYHVAVLYAQRVVVESRNTVRAESSGTYCPPQPSAPAPAPRPGAPPRPTPTPASRCDPSRPSDAGATTPASTERVQRTIRGFAIRRVSDGAVFWRTYIRTEQATVEQEISAAILELVMGR